MMQVSNKTAKNPLNPPTPSNSPLSQLRPRASLGEAGGDPQGENKVVPAIRIWGLAGEVGLLIVIPLLVLLLLGIRIDRAAGTTPLFIIVSLLLSFTVSTIAVARKVKQVQEVSK